MSTVSIIFMGFAVLLNKVDFLVRTLDPSGRNCGGLILFAAIFTVCDLLPKGCLSFRILLSSHVAPLVLRASTTSSQAWNSSAHARKSVWRAVCFVSFTAVWQKQRDVSVAKPEERLSTQKSGDLHFDE